MSRLQLVGIALAVIFCLVVLYMVHQRDKYYERYSIIQWGSDHADTMSPQGNAHPAAVAKRADNDGQAVARGSHAAPANGNPNERVVKPERLIVMVYGKYKLGATGCGEGPESEQSCWLCG